MVCYTHVCKCMCVYTFRHTHIIILHLDHSQLVISPVATTEAKVFVMSDPAIPWTVACQAPWDSPGKNTEPLPSPGNFPDPGIIAGRFFTI